MILFLDLELHQQLDLLLISDLYFRAILREILTSDLLILLTMILQYNTNVLSSAKCCPGKLLNAAYAQKS